MRTFVFESKQSFPASAEELFPFFAEAHNLEKITPPWLNFNVLTPEPILMDRGVVIDYRLHWRRVPMRWRTKITAWQPPLYFVDEQIRGPYRKWRHEHLFIDTNGCTTMTDRVEYAVPGGFLMQRLFVGRDVERIFAYRRRALDEVDIFSAPQVLALSLT